MISVTVESPEQCVRLDLFVKNHFNVGSRASAQRLVKSGCVLVNNAPQIALSQSVSVGQTVSINEESILDLQAETDTYNAPTPQDIDFEVVFENENLAVINKRPNLIVHPGAGIKDGTLVNGLLYKYGVNGLGSVRNAAEAGVVHRLDKDTSGLMLIAKNDFSQLHLMKQIETKSCIRRYIAICQGVFVPSCGTIDASLARHETDHKRFIASNATSEKEGFKHALTEYKTLQILQNGIASVVEMQLYTGRTHQIRVHAMHKGHHIVGDQVYGAKTAPRFVQNAKESRDAIKLLSKFHRQALHSSYIKFEEPETGEILEFTSPIWPDMAKLIESLKA